MNKELPTFYAPHPVAKELLAMTACHQHSGVLKDVENLDKKVEDMNKKLDVVRLAQAHMQGKWVIIAVIGMAAVSAVFKYLLP
jgi:hypothetical protein